MKDVGTWMYNLVPINLNFKKKGLIREIALIEIPEKALFFLNL